MVDSFFFSKHEDFHQLAFEPLKLLSGPPSCGKTSLLLQFAFNCALESSSTCHNVVFICNHHRLESKLPHLSQGVDPSCDVFQHIKMKYVEDIEDVKNYFAAFHLHDRYPAAVIIDDFGDFFSERGCQERYANPRGRNLAIVQTLALCHNAIIHANEKSPCQLLLCDTHHGNTPRLLYIYKRWIPTIFSIQGDGAGSFILKCDNYTTSTSATRRAKYSLAFQYLFLEGITEDDEG